MKFLNLLLVACFTLISSSLIIAQTCNADATISQTGSPGEVEIIDNSTTSSGGSATYSWVAFYDSPGWNYIGDVSLQPNSITGTFQFSQNGTYNYIINVQDSLTNCTDSISGSITITNFSLNCDANFTHIDTINNQTAFSPDNYDSNLDYYWDFGDGNSSTDPYPWHTYANPGTYTACLTVWDSANNGNCADTVCQTVVVDSNNCNVSADFSYIDLGNGTYDFTVNNINNNAFYEWSIGTDNYSASNVTHTFPSNGQFNATLFAMDSTNSTCVDTVSYTIHVTSADTCSIVANFTHIDTINNQTAFSPDNYDSNLDYFWDFGDGNWSTDPYPWHTYANPGTYTACLTVWDSANNGNCADTICQTIIVDSNNCNYSADFTYQDTLNNETAFFPDTYDPNLNYGWDFGDGNWSTDINPYHTYANPGNYTVCLTISESGSNGYCTDTVCQTIVVNSLSNCNADLTVNLTGNPGEVEIIDNSTTSSGSNATYSWVELYQNSPWNHEATINLQPNSNTATYQFTDNGTYTYYYTVQDSITNCFDTLMGSITINNVPSNCNAEFYLFQDSTNVNMYYAWDLSTGNNLDYHWDFGDGNSSNQQYPTHTYTSPGIYSLCLTITDAAGGCTDIYCDSVEALTKASGTTINILPEGETASLNNTETLENEVSLYPNPASSTINLKVESSKSSQVEYKVLDVTGKIVINNSMTISSGINDEKINVDHIRQGVYFIQITSLTTGERLDTLKFVKK